MKQRVREAASTVILEAAEEVAAERGLETTSIAAIAERAGVAVGTLYNYFPDRDSLLAALFKLRRAELVPRLVAAADATKHLPFEQRLAAYIEQVVTCFEDFRRFVRVAIAADQARLVVKGRQPALVQVTETLTEILRPRAGARAEEHARMLFGALKAMLHWRVEQDQPLEPAGKLLVETFLRGLVTP